MTSAGTPYVIRYSRLKINTRVPVNPKHIAANTHPVLLAEARPVLADDGALRSGVHRYEAIDRGQAVLYIDVTRCAALARPCTVDGRQRAAN